MQTTLTTPEVRAIYESLGNTLSMMRGGESDRIAKAARDKVQAVLMDLTLNEVDDLDAIAAGDEPAPATVTLTTWSPT